jgi:glycoside/pentoside/hexuronide:cation symporter, GPH family
MQLPMENGIMAMELLEWGNAASSFCMKVGSGLGTAALCWVLGAGGFDAKAATQRASSLTTIDLSFSWIPSAAMAVCVVCLLFFDLDKKYDAIVADLAEGKHRNDYQRGDQILLKEWEVLILEEE